RYCPSIEDKVVKFADKERHHVFVEPEGLRHPWLYLNGISTSLPPEVQEGVVHSIQGLEHAVIARYGYAVEYDFVNPEQLDPTLQVRNLNGLFLAGQINGTSGYEEAAAQGLFAGINAVQQLHGEEPLILRRDEAYAAVMIDDLVTLGTEEPYRMFTSRAEHRLLLGCDSVYERLSPIAERLGILDEERRQRAEARRSRMSRARCELSSATIAPDKETVEWFASMGVPLTMQTTVGKLMQRADFDLDRFIARSGEREAFASLARAVRELRDEELEGVINQTRYAGYIEKQEREARKLLQDENVRIPNAFAFRRPGLSREIVEKLEFVRPASLGQAARIPGVTPAAISLLRMYLKKHRDAAA
ncbi:MAG TPA: FAD-dependent oxidoreductase, partial [Thermoanaerobaculia bacterium]